MYHIYGYDLSTGEACLLHSLMYEKNAIDWAKGYTKDNLGGWNKVCVLYETEVDVDLTEEVIVWSIYQEPMSWSDNAMEEF